MGDRAHLGRQGDMRGLESGGKTLPGKPRVQRSLE